MKFTLKVQMQAGTIDTTIEEHQNQKETRVALDLPCRAPVFSGAEFEKLIDTWVSISDLNVSKIGLLDRSRSVLIASLELDYWIRG